MSLSVEIQWNILKVEIIYSTVEDWHLSFHISTVSAILIKIIKYISYGNTLLSVHANLFSEHEPFSASATIVN